MAAKLVALDTNVFIYALEGHAQFEKQARDLLSAIDQGQRSAVASVYVLTELLRRGPLEMREAIFAMRHIVFAPTTQAIALLAADIIRANSVKLHNVDAIHLATASLAGASQFWTNDRILSKAKVDGLVIRLLEDYDG